MSATRKRRGPAQEHIGEPLAVAIEGWETAFMKLLDAPWRARVAAALMLAFFFKISHAAAPWSTTIPDIAMGLALATIPIALLLESRRGRARQNA